MQYKAVYLLFCKFTLRVSGSTTPIIRSTQNCFHRGQASLATMEGGSCTKIWPVPEAVVTVLCTPDDGYGWHPKHVQWTCRLINRLLCVASGWTVINTDQRCTAINVKWLPLISHLIDTWWTVLNTVHSSSLEISYTAWSIIFKLYVLSLELLHG